MWKKSSHGMVKVNIDASFRADTLSKASGAVVRDDKRNFIAAASWFIPPVRDVDLAELMAIRNGIYVLSIIGCTKVEVESDCLFAVETLQSMDDYMGLTVLS
ncbi:Bidirectional sugar transporter SWEET14 [Hordeum vulgare]|nr:Bidirectional sugar transporter SWEET14 [Hordeum vulgare]